MVSSFEKFNSDPCRHISSTIYKRRQSLEELSFCPNRVYIQIGLKICHRSQILNSLTIPVQNTISIDRRQAIPESTAHSKVMKKHREDLEGIKDQMSQYEDARKEY